MKWALRRNYVTDILESELAAGTVHQQNCCSHNAALCIVPHDVNCGERFRSFDCPRFTPHLRLKHRVNRLVIKSCTSMKRGVYSLKFLATRKKLIITIPIISKSKGKSELFFLTVSPSVKNLDTEFCYATWYIWSFLLFCIEFSVLNM